VTEGMSDGSDQPQSATPDPAMPPPPPPPPPYGQQVTGYGAGPGQVGQIRGTGKCVLLTIVTLGIYTYFWYYGVHKEMQQYRNGQGLGGGLALVLAFFVGFVMPFLTAGEVGGLYESRGQAKPVSGVTGCWIFLPLVGGIVWFVKTNGALNSFWQSQGALPS
jgi:Domain of unknown function (DUF4234)